MATIKFVPVEDRHFVSIAQQVAENPELQKVTEDMPPGELAGATFTHHEGSPDTPQLFEVQLPPDTVIEAHAHDVDEILFVMQGEVHFGRQVYRTGSSVFIPKETLYSFQAGPEGMTFLNFRPNRSTGTGIITKQRLMEMREAHTSA